MNVIDGERVLSMNKGTNKQKPQLLVDKNIGTHFCFLFDKQMQLLMTFNTFVSEQR